MYVRALLAAMLLPQPLQTLTTYSPVELEPEYVPAQEGVGMAAVKL